MPNWNPLTNAVGGAGATAAQTYYNQNPTNFGEYGFIYLTEIIDNFMATYVGQNKILANVMRGDVTFHAHRGLQELHYDTLKSCKSHEIEVCPSLKMPLPHDYVNYVKLVRVDSNGIERPLYPNMHTSHPFAISQTDGCSYEFNDDGTLKHQQECLAGETQICNAEYLNDHWAHLLTVFYMQGIPVGNVCPYPYTPMLTYPLVLNFGGDDYTFNSAAEYMGAFTNALDSYCACLNTIRLEDGLPPSVNCGTYTPEPDPVTQCVTLADNTTHCSHWSGEGFWAADGGPSNNALDANSSFNSNYASVTIEQCYPAQNTTVSVIADAHFNLPSFTGTGTVDCTLTSNTWTSFQASSGNNITTSISNTTLDPTVDSSHYFDNSGARYGLQTNLANSNGTYYIDCARGNIHFSSDLAGETIILKYISDGHGTENEWIVPKLAEEAMYKWIAYGCAQARTDVDPGTIARLKKEKFAETRKAKIRISNIKLEEVSQVFRGKSKWIKH